MRGIPGTVLGLALVVSTLPRPSAAQEPTLVRTESGLVRGTAADGARVASFARAAESALLTGVVTYRERMALPPDAVLQVQLLDSSRADASAIVIGEQTIADPGQVPIAFAIPYRPQEIDPRLRYTLRARLTDGSGQLSFTSAEAYPVLTQGNATDTVEVLVQRVP